MKIVELKIEDLEDFGGVDAISLVERPAHESNWLAFNENETEKPIYELLSDEKLYELASEINKLGEPVGELEKQGYILWKIEEVDLPHQFSISSDPNDGGEADNEARIRYKYIGPKAERVFCQEMLKANRVFTSDDVEALSPLNPVGPTGYSVLKWRGSFNCRHKFVKLTYLPKDQSGNIVNKSLVRKGVVSEQVGTLYDTRTTATINAGNTPEPRVGGFSAFNVIDVIDEVPVFTTREEAETMAEILGCQGHHTHPMADGSTGYMPCQKHIFQSYNDYPQEASENACKVLKWIDEYGRDEVEGMELTGLARANQLCKREKITEETIARMAAFERHRENSEIAPEFKGTPWKDKGYVAWLGWGGSSGVEWAQRKLNQIREEMDLENACWPGYEAIGTKEEGGRVVPNCVPVKQSKEEMSCSCGKPKREFVFSVDEEKMEITGAAVIPNKFIVRKSNKGDLYYVFFSEDTTRRLADKFMKEMLLDKTNIEHSDKPADSYVKESWIVEDPNYDKSTGMGFNFPKGTWIVTMKVNNKDIWNKIKEGRLNGFSVEGWFNESLLFS